MSNIITRFMDMPTEIKGMTLLDDDGNYNIYINDRLCPFSRMETLKHELSHINNSDFRIDTNVKNVEEALCYA